MSRTIPYYIETIVPQSIALNQTVMISSSENAIRGLLMHLCDIQADRIAEVEIPTGLPLVYNINKRCIQVRTERMVHMCIYIFITH
jgi:2,3-bisphosphoglycerate-dependent phosphoglycerate mutase